jgi:hypothetical protein
MSEPIETGTVLTSGNRLLALSTSLNIGSAVCFTEGLAAALMLLVPQNHWFYIIGALLSLGSGLAFLRFRSTKMGAEIGDIWLFEFCLRIVILGLAYFIHIDPDVLWYPAAALSILKIIRVYTWQSSATQLNGWGTLGFMTRHYAKHYAKNDAPLPSFSRSKIAIEISLFIIIAALGSIFLKTLLDYERVIFMWVVPFTFEFLYGPMQLSKLKLFNNLLFASTQREAEKDVEIRRLKEEIERLQKSNNDLHNSMNTPQKAHAELIAAYESTAPERQGQVVQIAQLIAGTFSKKNPT